MWFVTNQGLVRDDTLPEYLLRRVLSYFLLCLSRDESSVGSIRNPFSHGPTLLVWPFVLSVVSYRIYGISTLSPTTHYLLPPPSSSVPYKSHGTLGVLPL